MRDFNLRSPVAAAFGVLLAAMVPSALAQDFESVEIKTTEVGDGIYMLAGRGGNMGLSVGPDGAFLIDDQFGELSDKIKAAVATLTDQPIRFVVNTHLHGDHVGGNAAMRAAGAIVVAHENVRRHLKVDREVKFFPRGDFTAPATPEEGLPFVTFTDSMTLHFNGHTIKVIKMPNAHTDGDSAIFFVEADVIHAGDAIRSGYPFVDVTAGGTLAGSIDFANEILAHMDADTKLISGHAPVMGRDGVIAYRDMLEVSRTRVLALIAEGKSVDEIVAAAPLANFDETWGGFMTAELFIRAIYDELSAGSW